MAGKRRTATQQAQDIAKDLLRARTTFIQEGDEKMANEMHGMQTSMVELLDAQTEEAAKAAAGKTTQKPS